MGVHAVEQRKMNWYLFSYQKCCNSPPLGSGSWLHMIEKKTYFGLSNSLRPPAFLGNALVLATKMSLDKDKSIS